jgi:hypothetical protein
MGALTLMGAQGTYKGFLDCAQQLIAKDGPSALFRGFGPAMARVRELSRAAYSFSRRARRRSPPTPRASWASVRLDSIV